LPVVVAGVRSSANKRNTNQVNAFSVKRQGLKKQVITRMCLIVLAIVLLLPNFFTASLFSESTYNQRETYDPHLAYINSLEKLQSHLSLPLPASTQWGIVNDGAHRLEPVLRELTRFGAQGEVLA